MKVMPSNLIFHELIGLNVEVIRSTNQSMVNIKGRVIDETRNLIVIETGDMFEKKIPKNGNVFAFDVYDHSTSTNKRVMISGNVLLSQPENRIKNIKKIRMR